MVYVGMDVHRKRTQVAILDDRGEQVLNRNVVNGSPEMAEILASVAHGTPAAFEAGYGWSWVVELCDELVSNPISPIRLVARRSRRRV